MKKEYTLHYILLGFLILAILYLVFAGGLQNQGEKTIIHTDSVIVREIKTIQVREIHIPAKVKIQIQRDTVYREKKEKETIVIGIETKKNEIIIQKIDTAGTISQDHHKIDEGSKVKVDSLGNVEEKKKTKAGKFISKAWKGVKAVAVVAGAVIVVYQIVK